MSKYDHPEFESAMGFRVGDFVAVKNWPLSAPVGRIVAIRSGYLTRHQSGIRAMIEWDRTTEEHMRWRLTARSMAPIETLEIVSRVEGVREHGIPDTASVVYLPEVPKDEAGRLQKKIDKLQSIVDEQRSTLIALEQRVIKMNHELNHITKDHWRLNNAFEEHADRLDDLSEVTP
jgi:hypothetical protein